MLVKQKTGSLHTIDVNNRHIDWLDMEWYETNKRILRKHTRSGKEVLMKFVNDHQGLTQDDVLFEDDNSIIAVDILPGDVLIITPSSMYEMAALCYEIGNKHLPLYFEQDHLLVPFEMPLYRLLVSQGYTVQQDKRKLLQPFKTTVSPHAHNSSGLFSKIMQFTNPSE